jgi:hypothetical protein
MGIEIGTKLEKQLLGIRTWLSTFSAWRAV